MSLTEANPLPTITNFNVVDKLDTKPNYKCQQCHRNRWKCDYETPSCTKCSTNSTKCVYVYKKPRVKKHKDMDYQKHVIKFSTKDDGLDWLSMDSFIGSKMGAPEKNKPTEACVSSNIYKSKGVRLENWNDQNNSFLFSEKSRPKKLYKTEFTLKSNCPEELFPSRSNFSSTYSPLSSPISVSSFTSTPPLSPCSPTSPSYNYDELLELCHSSYFLKVNCTFKLLNPISLNWKESQLINLSLSVLGLLSMEKEVILMKFPNITDLELMMFRNLLEDQLVRILVSMMDTRTSELVIGLILCHQISLVATLVNAQLHPILLWFTPTCLSMAQQIYSHIDQTSVFRDSNSDHNRSSSPAKHLETFDLGLILQVLEQLLYQNLACN